MTRKDKNSHIKSRICTTVDCGKQLNEYDRHDKCVTCLSPTHFQKSQKNHPCMICRDLAHTLIELGKLTGPGCPSPLGHGGGGGDLYQSQPGLVVDSLMPLLSHQSRAGLG